MNNANYIILDAAAMGGLVFKAKELSAQCVCLYKGNEGQQLSDVAPWLFKFEMGSAFSYWLTSLWGENNWGIFIDSKVGIEALEKHLRRFLVVKKENGKKMYLRYYDPRALRVFLPTCDELLLSDFFGPIDAFYAQNLLGNLQKYSRYEQKLEILKLNSGPEYFYEHELEIELSNDNEFIV